MQPRSVALRVSPVASDSSSSTTVSCPVIMVTSLTHGLTRCQVRLEGLEPPTTRLKAGDSTN